jgi:hypothetical protein
MATASITVYLQALGGKFLGPNAYQTNNIKVSLSYSGGTIDFPYQLVPGVSDDGIISQGFTDGTTSFMPILNMPALNGQNPHVFFLTPGPHTIAGQATLELSTSIQIATLTVSIPAPNDYMLQFTQAVTLTPEQTDYRITVVVPGLLLQANTENPIPSAVSVFATMMCGCKATVGLPTSFWDPNDFTVSANVQYKSGTQMVYTLSLNEQTNNSLFSAPVQNETEIQSIYFTAQQKSTGNFGALLQTM